MLVFVCLCFKLFISCTFKSLCVFLLSVWFCYCTAFHVQDFLCVCMFLYLACLYFIFYLLVCSVFANLCAVCLFVWQCRHFVISTFYFVSAIHSCCYSPMMFLDRTITKISTGDCVHIAGSIELSAHSFILDNTTGAFIIVHPDILVQGTSVAGATHCTRRAVLDSLFKNGSRASEATLLGIVAHQLFDEAMRKRDFSTSWLICVAKQLVRKVRNLDMMFSLGITEALVLEKTKEFIPTLQEWASVFVCESQQEEGCSTSIMR